MSATNIPHGLLHHHILRYLIDQGYAPSIETLAALLDQPVAAVRAALRALAEYHGVVLHPNSDRIWVIHPFSTAPTPFVLRAADGLWWGNCAWCSLGAAALLQRDLTISTTLGAEGEPVRLRVHNGQLLDQDYVVHFPVPMRHAWDNVIYTCSTMLLFRNRAEVERWSTRHQIPMGDVQPIQTVWDFAQVWYGQHLKPDWTKWSNQQAQQIFQRFGFDHEIWQIPASTSRF